MPVAPSTVHFGPNHSVGSIGMSPDSISIDWLVERWPTGTGVELRIRKEQVKAATDTVVGSFALLVEVHSAERWLCPFCSKNVKLLFGQLLLPFGRGQHDLLCDGRMAFFV